VTDTVTGGGWGYNNQKSTHGDHFRRRKWAYREGGVGPCNTFTQLEFATKRCGG